MAEEAALRCVNGCAHLSFYLYYVGFDGRVSENIADFAKHEKLSYGFIRSNYCTGGG